MKELIRRAIDSNIAVYDSDANIGELTPRLIKLLKFVYRKQYREEMKYLYIDPSIKLSNNCEWLDNQVKIPCKVVPYLNNQVEIYDYPKMKYKDCFVLAVGKNNAMLGMC